MSSQQPADQAAEQRRCDALVVSCMDFRIQAYIDAWFATVIGYGRYDRIAIAGGAKAQDIVLAQVDLAVNLHAVRLVLLLNHEDCGAYGAAGTLARHQADLRAAQARIQAAYPGVGVVCGYVLLDGTLVHVTRDGSATQQSLEAAVKQGIHNRAAG